jgi:hypothetical protein
MGIVKTVESQSDRSPLDTKRRQLLQKREGVADAIK